MNDSQRLIVQSSIPALRQHGEAIAQLFYTQLLDAHPELRPMFSTGNQESGLQARRLANAVLAYAANIDRLDLLGPAISKINARHAELQVLPEHYPIVGTHLLDAIEEVLGPAATPEVVGAWGAAYQQLADIMIDLESKPSQTCWNQVELSLLLPSRSDSIEPSPCGGDVGTAVLWRFPRAVGRVGDRQLHRRSSMLSIRPASPPLLPAAR
jgi:hemoglobin-like flavoprotein